MKKLALKLGHGIICALHLLYCPWTQQWGWQLVCLCCFFSTGLVRCEKEVSRQQQKPSAVGWKGKTFTLKLSGWIIFFNLLVGYFIESEEADNTNEPEHIFMHTDLVSIFDN